MNDEQVLELLSRTDAYAADTEMPAGAWAFDTAISEIERRINMDTRTTSKQTDPGRRLRGPLVAAAAFLVLIVVVGAVLLAISPGGGDIEPAATTTVPTTAPTTTLPTTVAPATTTAAVASSTELTVDGFFDDLNGGDVAALVGRFADDAMIGFGGPPGEVGIDDVHPDEFEGYFTWTVQSLPTTYEILSCDVIGTHASCRVAYTDALVDRLLGEPGQQFHIFDLEDGLITQYYVTFGGRESSLVLSPFITWVNETHPEAVETVWAVDCCYTFPNFNEASAQRYQELVNEYLETL